VTHTSISPETPLCNRQRPSTANVFVGWGQGNLDAAVPEDLNALNAPDQQFLDEQIPKLAAAGGGSWKDFRFLTEGGFCQVGIWEHHGQGAKPPRHRRVAVKEISDPFYNLRFEGMLMQRLGKSRSAHIVRLVPNLLMSTPLGRISARSGLELSDV
jgi:hypothetical protein